MKHKKKKNKPIKLSKERKLQINKMLDDFKVLIISNKDVLPKIFSNPENIDTNSWFDIKKASSTTYHNNIKFKKDKPEKEIIKCIKYDMILTPTHKKILNKWFDVSTKMYNETLTYIRNNFEFTKNEITQTTLKMQENNNQYKISELQKILTNKNINNRKHSNYISKRINRITNYINNKVADNDSNNLKNYFNEIFIKKQLKTIKAQLVEESQLENYNNDSRIYAHILDESSGQLISNIKSTRTNMLKGNIRKFRLKYWKFNRPSKTIDIEKELIKNNEICPLRLNSEQKIKYMYNDEEVIPNITKGIKINYNSILGKYTLLVPIAESPIINDSKTGNMISLDPGLRTFMTGITENSSIKIGSNVNRFIEKDIKRLNKINDNRNISNFIKKKNEKLINRKIKNRIDDLHWKSANYLVKNYNYILLGDMSVKSIVSRNNSVISASQKVACLRTNYYGFCQRLQFKCKQNNVTFKLVNESYTSKVCSNCGNKNDNLGAATVYNCDNCTTVIDRDVNGARNIYIKNLL